MPEIQSPVRRNAATMAPTCAIGARFDSKTRLLDQAILLARQGQFAESEQVAREALQLWPDDVDLLNELGGAVWRLDRAAEAEGIFRRASQLRPNDSRLLNNLGLALYEQGLLDEAATYFIRAVHLEPDAFDARMNLGIVRSDEGQLDEAMDWLLAARDVRPTSIEILQNLGMNRFRQGRAPEAISFYEEALRVQPENAEIHVNLAYALLCAGDYERGWREYEWRLKSAKHPGFRVNRPIWNGEDIRDRTILLHTEQGFGDNLQFMRFAPLVKERAGLVLARCEAPLLKLIARCNGIDLAYEGSSFEPNCHVHAPLLSLPAILGITLETLPRQVPYLVADQALVDHWGVELDKATKGAHGDGVSATDARVADGRSKPFRIGVVWQGNPAHTNDGWRSFRLSHFAPLAAVPGVQLICLQTEHGLEQLRDVDRRFPVVELPGRRCRDFMETAAIMTHLDLVITPDTALAHLAGGLGLPVWTGLCTIDEWRWLSGREDSPWYPTMRLFRQSTFGRWDDVFQRMKVALERELKMIATVA